mmetsp:Transcript_56613/g.132848  ORF Transcript_56613/g.132848 Transcript_56613/m.132848 type:complete len:224 (+) Transcript_56613:275-946(+)
MVVPLPIRLLAGLTLAIELVHILDHSQPFLRSRANVNEVRAQLLSSRYLSHRAHLKLPTLFVPALLDVWDAGVVESADTKTEHAILRVHATLILICMEYPSNELLLILQLILLHTSKVLHLHLRDPRQGLKLFEHCVLPIRVTASKRQHRCFCHHKFPYLVVASGHETNVLAVEVLRAVPVRVVQDDVSQDRPANLLGYCFHVCGMPDTWLPRPFVMLVAIEA